MLRSAIVLAALSIPLLASASPVTGSLDTSLEQIKLPTSARAYDLGGSAGMTARDDAMGSNSAQYIRFRLSGQGAYRFSQRLRLDAMLEASFDSGHAQSGTEAGSRNAAQIKNSMDIREAAFTYRPWDITEFRAGALSQDSLDAPLLIYRNTFPAVSEAFIWNTSPIRFTLGLEQAIPSGTTMATQASNQEAMPRLAIESIKATAHLRKDWDVTASLLRFSFFDLPTAVADDSRMMGNTVDGEKNARYRYGFQGFHYGLSTSGRLSRTLTSKLGVQYLHNQLAPAGHNDGYLAFNEWLFRLNSRLEFLPRYTYFYNESDSSPGYYNSWAYGHNNAYGQSLELAFHFTKLGITAGGRMVRSRNLETTPFQDASLLNHSYMITVETDYAKL